VIISLEINRVDVKRIEDAIAKAISAKAIMAPPPDESSSQTLLPPEGEFRVRNQDAFDNYIAEVAQDPVMLRFNTTYVAGLNSYELRLTTVARLLLARAINSQDVPKTVEEFRFYIEKNAARAIAVIAISGITVEGVVSIGPKIRLVRMDSLPPSMQRGLVLGYRSSILNEASKLEPYYCPSALVKDVEVSPVFLWPEDTEKPTKERRMRELIKNTFDELEESRTLLALLNQTFVARYEWVQGSDLSICIGIGQSIRSVQRNDGASYDHCRIDEADLKQLGEEYFRIGPAPRHDILRIPLDRLDRAKRQFDLTDSFIDLGIALEALLLHGIERQSELRFRLALRGAWLGGSDSVKRIEMQTAISKVYDLRSKAVHFGVVKRDAKNVQINKTGIEICIELIRKTIGSDCKIDWDKLVLGG
jgi:hypothetical protein